MHRSQRGYIEERPSRIDHRKWNISGPRSRSYERSAPYRFRSSSNHANFDEYASSNYGRTFVPPNSDVQVIDPRGYYNAMNLVPPNSDVQVIDGRGYYNGMNLVPPNSDVQVIDGRGYYNGMNLVPPNSDVQVIDGRGYYNGMNLVPPNSDVQVIDGRGQKVRDSRGVERGYGRDSCASYSGQVRSSHASYHDQVGSPQLYFHSELYLPRYVIERNEYFRHYNDWQSENYFRRPQSNYPRVGGADMDPFGHATEGMLVDHSSLGIPLRPTLQEFGVGHPDCVATGSIPSGARFDPFLPPIMLNRGRRNPDSPDIPS